LSKPDSPRVHVLRSNNLVTASAPSHSLWPNDVEKFLDSLPETPLFDLVITSPPYNIGKPYEEPLKLEEYRTWQSRVISKITKRLKNTGSICWQVGTFISSNGRAGEKGYLYPLDFLFHPLFEAEGLTLRNRIIWHFGHGLHCKFRFSGRYEVVLWYSKSDEYVFNLDEVRIPSKYPGKTHYKGSKKGKYSSNPKGKNPEDVWNNIPNVKSNHKEKTVHPCQFPVGLAERLILALSNPGDLVFDPFAGVGSAGVAAAIHDRRFWGCELDKKYIEVAKERIQNALDGKAKYRPHNQPLYDHNQSKLSKKPTQG
jgi:adenine-specific DNA-methyltransferase